MNFQGGTSGLLYFRSTKVRKSTEKYEEIQRSTRSTKKYREVPRSTKKYKEVQEVQKSAWSPCEFQKTSGCGGVFYKNLSLAR
jgi:hypothetical protein